MMRFMRWLKNIARWVCEVPVAHHYWWAFVPVVLALAVTWMSGWSEMASRLSGMLLQIGGVLTVVWGILKTRADFGQPTVRSQFQCWLKTFPSLNPRTITVSMNASLPSLMGRAYSYPTHGPSVDQTVEGRLSHLENIVKQLEVAQGKAYIAALQAEEQAQQALDTQSRQLTGEIAHVLRKVEATATGGIHVSGVGVVLLFFGTILSGVAPDLRKWVEILG